MESKLRRRTIRSRACSRSARSAAPKARPSAMLFRRASRAQHWRQVKRVSGVVPTGTEIGFPPHVEQSSVRRVISGSAVIAVKTAS